MSELTELANKVAREGQAKEDALNEKAFETSKKIYFMSFLRELSLRNDIKCLKERHSDHATTNLAGNSRLVRDEWAEWQGFSTRYRNWDETPIPIQRILIGIESLCSEKISLNKDLGVFFTPKSLKKGFGFYLNGEAADYFSIVSIA